MKTINSKVKNCLETWGWQEVKQIKETKTTIFYEHIEGMQFKVSKKTGILMILNNITKKWHKLVVVDI